MRRKCIIFKLSVRKCFHFFEIEKVEKKKRKRIDVNISSTKCGLRSEVAGD